MDLGFEAWILDFKVVLLTVMLAWPLLASWSVSVTCSHKDAESRASLSLRSTRQKTFVSELMAWPGCSVRSAGLSGTHRDSGVVRLDQVALLISSGLSHMSGGCENKRFNILTFLKALLFFLWSFFHWLYDLHDICSIPSVLLIIIFRVSVVLYYDNNNQQQSLEYILMH